MKEYLQSLTYCPFCHETLSIDDGGRDFLDCITNMRYALECPNLHSSSKRPNCKLQFWGWAGPNPNNITSFNVVLDNKIQITWNLRLNTTTIRSTNDLILNQIISFPFEEEKFKNKLKTILLFS